MTAKKSLLTLSLVLMFAPAPAAVAQAKRPMTLIDLLEVPQVGDPQLSPDGRQLLYVLSKSDWKANRRITHIWRINADGTSPLQLTNGSRGENSPRWSPDGKLIAFLAGRPAADGNEDHAQIYLMNNAGGEARRLTDHDTSVSDIAWAPAGDTIYFRASEPESALEKEKAKVKDDVVDFERDYKQTHLWKVTVADKKEHRLTNGDYSVGRYILSRDGGKILFARTPDPLLGNRELSELYIMTSRGGEVVRLTNNRIPEGDMDLSPDNSRVLFTAAANGSFETYYNNKLFLVPAGGGEAHLALPDFPFAVDSARWSKDGKSVLMICNLGMHNELFQVDVATGSYKQLTDGEHVLRDWTYSAASDKDVFTISDPYSPGEIYSLDAGSATPVRITGIFDYIGREFSLPKEEGIRWKGEDGVTVEGILTYPVGYQAGRRYPLVVKTHGGPRSSDMFSFSSWSTYRPVLAAKGYAILQPNYRGSTGYGDDFLRNMVGHYFNQAHLDVLAGVDYLIERGIADPARLVKMGWSAGGHMTNKIITFTDRFKAASSGAGAANWVSMYAQSDVRDNRTPWFGGTPWQKDAPIDVYWNNSPLKDVAKVTTPTIFLVGEQDERVPMPQSVEMYRALKSNGIPTHLYVAPREPHGWRELRHELFKMNVELEWFEKYALNRTYVWEKAPEK